MNNKELLFPKNFLWGTSTSAHQVEGNNVNNDWWAFEQEGNIENKETSGAAVDHYNRFEEDFDIAKSLGQNVHRLSIEWSRIEPKEGEFNIKEIKHYQRVLEALRSRGIKTMVTLFHFTIPLWFAQKGGWENVNAVRYFLGFAEYVVRYLFPYVDFWITINEPTIYAANAYYKGIFPPKKRGVPKFFKVLSTLLRANRETYFLIHSYNRDAEVGLSHHYVYFVPFNKNSFKDKLVTSLANRFINEKVLKDIAAYSDFLGLQYYVRIELKFRLGGTYLRVADEYGIFNHRDTSVQLTEMGWEIHPEGLYFALKDLAKFDKPIIITENGIADASDKLRPKFIHDHLLSVHKAISEGVNVFGYIYWSSLDNFEWTYGTRPRFGLVEIDYQNNVQRKLRPSASYFADICRNNKLTLGS